MKGPIEEFPNVSVDNFGKADGNYSSTCFFLTHCHKDHMRGLLEFVPFLKKKGYYLYCSKISRHILMNSSYGFEEDNIRVVENTMLIEVPSNERNHQPYLLTVTPIPAGHSPGSIMFLFRDSKQTVLFTGDFRILEEDLPKLRQLRDYLNGSKSIDTIYIDKTFYSEKYFKFRDRAEYTDIAIAVIKKKFTENPNYHVDILTGAQGGYEDFFIRLAEKFKQRIHVDEDYYNKFSIIPSVRMILTKDEKETRFHYYEGSKRIRSVTIPEPFYQLKLCAMSFSWDESDVVKTETNRSRLVHKVCYPTHCSFSELKYFISSLKCDNIRPITDTYALHLYM